MPPAGGAGPQRSEEKTACGTQISNTLLRFAAFCVIIEAKTAIMTETKKENEMKNNDALFAARAFCTDGLRVQGLWPAARSEADIFLKYDNGGNRSSLVLPLKHGNAYVVRFPQKPAALRCALCSADPRQLAEGTGMSAPVSADIPYFDGCPDADDVDFLCVPQKADKFLVICTGEAEAAVTVEEFPVILGHDTDDCWFYTEPCGSLEGGEGSWGNWRWTAEELYNNVYEPLRKKYPDYITRQWIGRDATDRFDMHAYIFEPENWEQLLFITGGLHGNETDGYLGLARFLQLMCESDGTHEGLEYLRRRVKLVVVPLVNVCKDDPAAPIRQNGCGIDLNRDFAAHSQSETVNVIWLLHQYAGQAAALIDYHTARARAAGLYYQFSIQAPNSAVCRKVVNHIHERLKEHGWESDPADLSLIPGKFNKSSVYLQGYAWNRFGIPTLVVEHNSERWYAPHSEAGLQHAVECYGNFLIQTALAKLKVIR